MVGSAFERLKLPLGRLLVTGLACSVADEASQVISVLNRHASPRLFAVNVIGIVAVCLGGPGRHRAWDWAVLHSSSLASGWWTDIAAAQPVGSPCCWEVWYSAISTMRPKDCCVSNLGGSPSGTISPLGSRCTGLARCCFCPILWGWAAIFFAFQIPNSSDGCFGQRFPAAFLPTVRRHQKDRPLARFAAAGTRPSHGSDRLLEMVLFYCTLKENTPLAVELLRIVLPYAPMVCLVALLGPPGSRPIRPHGGPPAILNVALVVGVLTGPDGDPQARMHCALGRFWSPVLQVVRLLRCWAINPCQTQPGRR